MRGFNSKKSLTEAPAPLCRCGSNDRERSAVASGAGSHHRRDRRGFSAGDSGYGGATRTNDQRAFEFQVSPPDGVVFSVGTIQVLLLTLSGTLPDGRYLAFVAVSDDRSSVSGSARWTPTWLSRCPAPRMSCAVLVAR